MLPPIELIRKTTNTPLPSQVKFFPLALCALLLVSNAHSAEQALPQASVTNEQGSYLISADRAIDQNLSTITFKWQIQEPEGTVAKRATIRTGKMLTVREAASRLSMVFSGTPADPPQQIGHLDHGGMVRIEMAPGGGVVFSYMTKGGNDTAITFDPPSAKIFAGLIKEMLHGNY